MSTILTNTEMLHLLEVLTDIETEAHHSLPVSHTDSYRDLMITLMRRHLESRPTTLSSLARATSAPYATAVRRIEAMIKSGLIVKRRRSKTGKTFSLHPSRTMIDAWYDYARRVQDILRSAELHARRASEHCAEEFTGTNSASRILAIPTVLERPINFMTSLRILVHIDPMFMAMDGLKRQFQQILGVPIQARALSIDRLRTTALAHATDAQSPFDIIACDLPWIGEFAEKNVLMPLDDFIADSGIATTDFHRSSWEACGHRRQQYGIPVQTTPELLLYRTDIFEQHGLKPPQTAEDVLDAAARLHKPAQGLRGIAWNAARGTPLGHTFLFAMAAFGQPVINLQSIDGCGRTEAVNGEHYRPMIATPEGRAAAHYLRRLLDYSPLDILSMAWPERVASYARGEVAMAFCYTLLAPVFELDKASPAYRRTGFLPHPHGPNGRNIAPLGGFALGIPRNIARERVAGALQALQVFTSAEACKAYILNGSLVSPRFSVGADPEVRSLSSVISITDEMARSGLQQYWPRPPVSEIADIIAICGEEMHEALRDLKSVDVAIDAAQNRADVLMRSHGHY